MFLLPQLQESVTKLCAHPELIFPNKKRAVPGSSVCRWQPSAPGPVEKPCWSQAMPCVPAFIYEVMYSSENAGVGV